jgi:predicted dehydrogenase
MNNKMETDLDGKTLSLGFIGVGWIGKNRMEVLLDKGKISSVTIAEPSEQNAEEALRIAQGAVLAASPEEIYKNRDIDGVVIATPSALHTAQSLQALKSGKAVFCQKPLGRTAAEVEQVLNASREADRLLSVDLSYRYTKAFQAVYDTITEGQIGKVYAVELVFHNAYGPDKEWFYDIDQSGGGCVMDLGIHLIDMAMCCLGYPEVTELKSYLFSKGVKLEPDEKKVEDFAKTAMLTDKGSAITLECSWHASAGEDAVIRAVFYGTEGGVAFKNINGSFYDFQAEKYKGTSKEIMAGPPDNWGGKAGLAWSDKIRRSNGYDHVTASEYLKTAQIIDRIYGR